MSEKTTAPETTEAPAIKPKTGFAVFIDDEGNIFIERAPEALAIEVSRPATLLEVRRCMHEVLADLQAQAAAEYTRIALTQIPAPAQPEE